MKYYREPPILNAHNNTDVILRLPMGRRMRDIRWLSVWCRRFTVKSHLIIFNIYMYRLVSTGAI